MATTNKTTGPKRYKTPEGRWSFLTPEELAAYRAEPHCVVCGALDWLQTAAGFQCGDCNCTEADLRSEGPHGAPWMDPEDADAVTAYVEARRLVLEGPVRS